MAFVTRRHENHSALPFPHKCFQCNYGGEDREFYLDTGFNTEWDGAIIICSACFPHLLMGAYGLNPFKVIERLTLDHKDQDTELEAARDLIIRANASLANLGLTLEGVINLGRAIGNDGTDGIPIGEPILGVVGESGELGEVVELFGRDSDADESEPTDQHGPSSSDDESDDVEAGGNVKPLGVIFDLTPNFRLSD